MSKRKLLLADDSVTIQKVVNLTFADEGIDVITVGDGDSAMQKIAQDAPDVVLADVHMPGLNGYQVCQLLRENPATNGIPVVLLVGSFEPFDEGEAERVGANAYLTKPFQSIRQLVSQVSDLIEMRSARAEQPDEASAAVSDEVDSGIEERAAVAGAADPGSEKPRDTTDIDSLYHQSMSAPAAAPESEIQTQAEETTQASFHDLPTTEAVAAPYSEAGYDMPPSEPVPAPYVDVGMDDEMIEARSGDEGIAETTADYDVSSIEENDVTEPAQPEPVAASPFDTIAMAAEDDNGASALEGQATESHFDQFAATEQIPASQMPNVDEFELDEIELLELPPLENGNTLEFTTTERNIALGGNKQVVSLSPELIDVIVEKVVDKLSGKY